MNCRMFNKQHPHLCPLGDTSSTAIPRLWQLEISRQDKCPLEGKIAHQMPIYLKTASLDLQLLAFCSQ